MSNSNAIEDILDELTAVWDETSDILPGTLQGKAIGVGFTIIGKAQAKQSLYEAVVMCVPGRKSQRTQHSRGFNDCHDEVLTNLAELFGVEK